MEPSKNAPCPCGSGKKYKRCCIDKPRQVNTPISGGKAASNPFFLKYNTVSLLQAFAGLSLIPENHGKFVRFEELARTSIQNYNINTEIPSANTLKEFLDAEYPSNYMEDPSSNLFTDLVTFHGGDYLLFPGMTESGSFILTNLLAAVFHWPDSKIPGQFVINSRHTVSFILAISNEMAQRLGYKRYQEGTGQEVEIQVPDDTTLNKLKAAVTFTTEEIEELCNKHGIDKLAVKEFLIDIKSSDLNSPYVKESPLIYKPILNVDGKYIVVSPATLSLAITDYIWSTADSGGCMKEVNEAYHSVLWNNLQMILGQMKFKRINVEGIELNEREGLYRFDDDKIAFIQYMYDNGIDYKTNKTHSKGAFGNPSDKEKHKKELIAQLLAKPEIAGHEIFDFIILSPIGRMYMYPIMKTKNARTLAIPMFELDVLWNLKNAKALDLLKFAIAREEQIPDSKMMSFSFLDQYNLYQDNDDSFYLSDKTKYDSIHVQVGYSDKLIKAAKQKADRHSAPKNIEGKLFNVQVERKDEYAPVYIDLMGLTRSELDFLVEGFHQSVWVTPKQDIKEVKGSLRQMYWELNDAIAYWLWQVQDDINEFLKPLGRNPLAVSYDLTPIEKFETIERGFLRDPKLEDKFYSEASKDSINVIIPSEIIPYLYGADNEGERILLKQLLIGINKLLTANNLAIIPDKIILQIIEDKAPLGMKKKLFILDTSDNFLLDPTNLKSHRYVQEYDTNIVLNSIVPALGSLCPPVGEISTKKERDDLSFKIVQNALLPILRNKISQYDSTELLKRLIGLNESLIKRREEQRIQTPTRIACFVSIEQHQMDLKEGLANINRTSIALRCLIEHIAAEPTKGTKIISIAAIDELVAIMDQVISWGSLSDQIHFDLFDVKMSVLPTGRIGTEKTKLNEVFDPYYEAKTKENMVDAISTFDQVFAQNKKSEGKSIPEGLDNAFLKDYGISFSRIGQFIEALVHIGLRQTTPFASMTLADLREAVNKFLVDSFDDTEYSNTINYLTLVNRGKIENLPTGYEFIDIMPWRFNRMLSYLRKPLVLVEAETPEGSKIIYWGARQVLASRRYLDDQCTSDRLRVFENSEVKKELGKFANERGEALVKKIVELLKSNSLIIDKDVYIGPNYSLKNAIDIGDIDILIIDTINKIIFSLECKSMSPSRNIKEMIEEVQKLFGSKSEIGWIDKHLRRHTWIEGNKDKLSVKYGVDVSEYTIKSFFVTNEDMLTPYLKKQALSIPFITSYEIEKEGYNSLIK